MPMTSYTKGFDSIVAIIGHRYNPYRFAFNGKENDDEIKGSGNSYDYGKRIYDPRIGRFLTPDPLIIHEKKYPWYSPYQFAGNKPIWAVDLDGLEEKVVNIWYDMNQSVTKIDVISVLDKNNNPMQLNITDDKGNNYSSSKYLINYHFSNGTNFLKGTDKVDAIIEDIDKNFKKEIQPQQALKQLKSTNNGINYRSRDLNGTSCYQSAIIKAFTFQLDSEKTLEENNDKVKQANGSSFNYNRVLNSSRKSEVEETQTNSTPTDLPIDNTPNVKTEKVVKIKLEPNKY